MLKHAVAFSKNGNKFKGNIVLDTKNEVLHLTNVNTAQYKFKFSLAKERVKDVELTREYSYKPQTLHLTQNGNRYKIQPNGIRNLAEQELNDFFDLCFPYIDEMTRTELRKEIARKHGPIKYFMTNQLKLGYDEQKLREMVGYCRRHESWGDDAPMKKPAEWKDHDGTPVSLRRRLAADPSALSGSSSLLLFSMIPLLFLVYWFFSRRFQTPAKRSRKQSTYRCHYPENAEDFSDVEPEIDMV